MMYAELVYFDGAYYAHIATQQEFLRLKVITAANLAATTGRRSALLFSELPTIV